MNADPHGITNFRGVTAMGYTSGFTTDAPTSTTIAKSGGTAVVHVMAPAVPFPAAIPTNYPATLTLGTDIPGDTDHVIDPFGHWGGLRLWYSDRFGQVISPLPYHGTTR